MNPRRGPITHLVRALVVGGSELETLAITRRLTRFRHRVLRPARFADWEPSIRERFGAEVEVATSAKWEQELERARLLHIQFPFLLTSDPVGHDSVLELGHLPRVPTLFTVHAAVNVPVVPELHYVFHTAALRQRFPELPDERCTVVPSLVELPPEAPRRTLRERTRILWVSRNEDAKFHPDLAGICAEVLRACPTAEFRFVGRPENFALPVHERVSSIPCPAVDLAAEYRAADLFWSFPHPLLEETWCRTVTEAMGAGLPCVVAAHGAPAWQLAADQAGRVAATPAACATELIDLVRAPELRARLGARGRQRALDFARDAQNVLDELYSRFLPS